jgi:hypothetical protein
MASKIKFNLSNARDPRNDPHVYRQRTNIKDYKTSSIQELKDEKKLKNKNFGVGGRKRIAELNARQLEERTRNKYVKREKQKKSSQPGEYQSDEHIENDIKQQFSESFKLVINNVIISADKLQFSTGTTKYKQKPMLATIKSYIWDNRLSNFFKRNVKKLAFSVGAGLYISYTTFMDYPAIVTDLFGGTEQVIAKLRKEKKLISEKILNNESIDYFIENMSDKARNIFIDGCSAFNVNYVKNMLQPSQNPWIVGLLAVAVVFAGASLSGAWQEHTYNTDVKKMQQIASDLDDVIMEDYNYHQAKNIPADNMLMQVKVQKFLDETPDGKHKIAKQTSVELQNKIDYLNRLKQSITLTQVFYHAVRTIKLQNLLSEEHTNELFNVVFGKSLKHLEVIYSNNPDSVPEELEQKSSDSYQMILLYYLKNKYYNMMLEAPFKAYYEFKTTDIDPLTDHNLNIIILKYVFGENNLQNLNLLYSKYANKFKNFNSDLTDMKHELGLGLNKYNSVGVEQYVSRMIALFKDQIKIDNIKSLSQNVFTDSKDQLMLENWLNCDKSDITCKKRIMFIHTIAQNYNISIHHKNVKNKDGYNIISNIPNSVEYFKDATTPINIPIDVDIFMDRINIDSKDLQDVSKKITRSLTMMTTPRSFV